MTFLDKLLKKEEDVDIDEVLNNIDVEEETMYDNADAFVKPINLSRQEDAQMVVNEAKAGNIVLVNIADLGKRNAIKLKEYITEIKRGVVEIDGDIARISQEKIIVTPSRVKIIKKK